jgi:hypothetical protein
MKNIIDAIDESLKTKNWYSALVLSLILPDICGKLEEPTKNSSIRYTEWFGKYLGNKYQGFLTGNDCYALRCSFIHEGSSDIEQQKKQEILDKFVFIDDGPHLNLFKNCHLGDPQFDGKDFLQMSVKEFSHDMINAVNNWFIDVAQNQIIQQRLKGMLKIHKRVISIGAVIIGKNFERD